MITLWHVSDHGHRTQADDSEPVCALTSDDRSHVIELFRSDGKLHLHAQTISEGPRSSTSSSHQVRLTPRERADLLLLVQGALASVLVGQLTVQRPGGGELVLHGHVLGSGLLIEDRDSCDHWCQLAAQLLGDVRNW